MVDIKSRIQQEHKTLHAMLRIYCEGLHSTHGSLCESCAAIVDYADKRVERCHWGPNKPACSQCTTHCFVPEKRQRIREIMRYSGPRMTTRHPILALLHLFTKLSRKVHVRPKE